MRSSKLRLKGFIGIRDGFGRDEIVIDIDALAGDAQLIALAGPNGKGKSTIMDNMHPYRIMPSRATSNSVKGFSYYDEIYLPESIKELEWEHHGQRYWTQLVFRVNGTKKTDAFLHQWDGGKWVPMILPDGTRSDGKTDTYDRCVEWILGSPETFFTSAFSAQNRRPLSSYKNAEITALMVELLGLENVRALGQQAHRVGTLLRVALADRQEQLRALGKMREASEELSRRLSEAQQRVVGLAGDRTAAQLLVDACQDGVSRLTVAKEAAAEDEARRARLAEQYASVCDGRDKALAAMRLEKARLDKRLHELAVASTQTRLAAEKQLQARRMDMDGAQSLISRREAITCAVARLAVMAQEEDAAAQAVAAARAKWAERQALEQQVAVLRARIASLEREAGAAAVKARELQDKLGLAAEVPCRGTGLQEACKLLGDARLANSLMPSAHAEIDRIRAELNKAKSQESEAVAKLVALEKATDELAASEEAQRVLSMERRSLEQVAALSEPLAQAEERIARAKQEVAEIESALAARLAELEAEREQLTMAVDGFTARENETNDYWQQQLDAVSQELANMPPAFDEAALAQSIAALHQAQAAAARAEQEYMQAVQAEAELAGQLKAIGHSLGDEARAVQETKRLEQELGWWNLLSKAFGSDGIIALSIDDAGPELANITNDLLLTCYGPRFTVAITTQVETAKKELKEEFDVLVFDAQTSTSKSVKKMSGGERVWINECMTRAIAIYLAQTSGRQYQTLFSDEADGPLDVERKRMFIDMKRRVLALGGYEREFFVSQTPDLWSLADKVIDVTSLV